MDAAASKELEVLKKQLKPVPTIDAAIELFHSYWRHEGTVQSMKPLDSYDDCNFYVTTTSNKKFLMKYCNGVESDNSALIQGFHEMMEHLFTFCPQLHFPRSVLSTQERNVEYVSNCPTFGNIPYNIAVRVYSWIDGITLNEAGSSATLLEKEGRAIGAMTIALHSLSHPALHRVQFWDGESIPFLSRHNKHLMEI